MLRAVRASAIASIKNVSEAAVVLGEIGHQACRLRDLVKGIVPLLLLAQHGAQGEVQSSTLRIVAQHFAQQKFGLMVVLLTRRRRGLQQNRRNRCVRAAAGNRFRSAQSADQISIGARSLKLSEFLLPRDVRHTLLMHHAYQPVAGNTSHQPSRDLGGIYRLAVGRKSSGHHTKKKDERQERLRFHRLPHA
jgi:hypothetical protein